MKQIVFRISVAATLSALTAPGLAQNPAAHTVLPPAANTADAAAPFYIDLSGLDLRTSPPTRDPANPSYPAATRLPDGVLPSTDQNGNFIIGPSHAPAPETTERATVPKGQVYSFTLSSKDSAYYRPGVLREEATFNSSLQTANTAPADPSNLIVTTSHAGAWARTVRVYVPAGYSSRRPLPFMVIGDGEIAFNGGRQLMTVLDNLIADHKIPPVAAVMIGSGGQDAQGSERGREYDTVSGAYAAWVEAEVLPLAERSAHVKLTRDPKGRGTVGISSSGVAAFTMAWFRSDLYRRVLAFSPTFVNQQWPHDPALPGGAWEYHSPWAGPARRKLEVRGFGSPVASDAPTTSPLIPTSPRKPLRIWFSVGDRDNFYPLPQMSDGMHDWVLANENMARVLAQKDYAYQFVFARNAGHVDGAVTAQTLPAALEWLWAGYPRAIPQLVTSTERQRRPCDCLPIHGNPRPKRHRTYHSRLGTGVPQAALSYASAHAD